MGGLLDGVYAGEIRAIARMMSLAEGARAPAHNAMGEIYRRAGRAHVVGLTGSPGSGKSTLVGALARTVRKSGRKVGIVAVDPSSPFSGGAILGDRIRMTDLATDKGVFVRSLATRGRLGGLASASLDTVDILDAAGFDLVFIDADKVNYNEYFEQVLPKTRKGGLIISDNVMWSGKVIQKPDPKDVSTIALQDYNKKLKKDSRIKTLLLPFRDGLNLSWVL